jgi:hypothetical protein
MAAPAAKTAMRQLFGVAGSRRAWLPSTRVRGCLQSMITDWPLLLAKGQPMCARKACHANRANTRDSCQHALGHKADDCP